LPFSQVSATASTVRFSSIRSAILSRTLERSVVDVRPHDSAAACAASRAASMSSSVPRAISVNGLPLTGEMFSK
jgi:hypothetical protein